MTIIALASVINYNRHSDAPIWSVTSSGVNYDRNKFIIQATGNTKGGGITVLLTSCLTCLDKPVLQIKTKIVSCHTADSKPVKLEVNCIVILPPLVFPDLPLPAILYLAEITFSGKQCSLTMSEIA